MMKIQRFKKIFFFFFMYKMVIITVKNCLNARVHIVTEGNRKLFWIKMIDIRNGLGFKVCLI